MTHIFSARRYLRVYGISLLVFSLFALVLFFLSWRYLIRIGELSLPYVIERQRTQKFCIFGSGIEQDNYTYKLALYDAIRPDIAVLGSSRVMQIRGRYFRGRFVNLGGAAGSTVAISRVIDEMLKCHVPKLVIVGVDFWWFNYAYSKNKNTATVPAGAYSVTYDRLKMPFYWLAQGKVDFKDVFYTFREQGRNESRLGVMATKLGDGFGPDGSYYYTSVVTGARPTGAASFGEALSRVQEGRDRFEWGENISEEDVLRFTSALRRLEDAGSTVILFMPPLADPVYREVLTSGNRYAYLKKLPLALQRSGLDVSNFTDSGELGGNDCEFVDGFHGGELTYVRILEKLAVKFPVLKNELDNDEIQGALSRWSGFAMVPNQALTDRQEVDFLGIGCNKTDVYTY